MGLIINPFEKSPEQEAEEKQDAINQKLYESYPALRKRADNLHHNRLLSGPACAQCIAAMIAKMEKEGVVFNAQT